MKSSDIRIVQILQQICQQYGEGAARHLEVQAAECEGRDEAKRSLYLRLHSVLTQSA
jgi:hypothetical protein